jgi:pimeloyl-ACP methyl ester carboxylesterase
MMEEEKFSILNENEHEIRGTIYRPKRTGKFSVVVLAGDLVDTSDSSYTKELAKLLLEENIAVVRFDFTNGFGKSDGRIENVTVSQRARDLELIVNHLKRRNYIQDAKVSVVGVAFGAMATLAMEGFHALCKTIILVDCPSMAEDTGYTGFSERDMMRVKLKRYFHIIKEGKEVRINYTFLEDGFRVDALRCARNLRTPVLYICGGEDSIVKPVHSDRLFERTNGKKELVRVESLAKESERKRAHIIFSNTIAFLKKNRAI